VGWRVRGRQVMQRKLCAQHWPCKHVFMGLPARCAVVSGRQPGRSE